MIPQTLIDCVRKSRTNISNYLAQLPSPNICEVGVRFGDNFSTLLTSNVEVAVAVDPWMLFESQECDPEATYTQQDLDRQCDDFKIRFLDKDSRVKLNRSTSLEAAINYPDHYFDFIYIDGNHTYHHCKSDLTAWWPKVKIGGILAGHDYINHRDYGVIQAVEEFKSENSISSENSFTNEENYASYYLMKG